MTTRGSGLTATGLAVTMISVGVGVSSGGSLLVLLLSFAGLLAGAGLIFAGIRIADDPTAPISRPWVLVAGVHVRALVHCMRRNIALSGLLLASAAASATMVAADMEAAVVCFCAFVLLLLGLSLLNIGVLLGEQEQ